MATDDNKSEGKRLLAEIRSIMVDMQCQGVPLPVLAVVEREAMRLELELERATR